MKLVLLMQLLQASLWLRSAAGPVPTAICKASTADSITISWESSSEFNLYYVQLSDNSSAESLSQPFALQTAASGPVVVSGLAPDTVYVVALRALPVKAPSMAWGPAWVQQAGSAECRTSAAAASSAESPRASRPQERRSGGATTEFLRVYRIAEYAADADFLPNHDAASIEAMPLYLMTCDPQGDCAPFDAKLQSPKWDACHETLAELCPSDRGAAFNCMVCADANREQVAASCGNWTAQDTTKGEGSFAVHWWCGVGWPESAAVQGPITEYCVEYQPLEGEGFSRAGKGFSDYLSCNSDEVDGTLGNDPRDPSCLCIVWDDRLLAHQSNASSLLEDCYVGHMSWLSEKPCNCTGQLPKSPVPHSGNPSLTHIGRMPVWLPYVGVLMTPYVPGSPQVASGYNYHFPKGGQCAEDEAVGTNGCTWRRMPRARMIYGQQLLEQGWDLTFVPDTPTDQSHTHGNVQAFKAALDALGRKVQAVPCGSEEELPESILI